MKAKIEALEKDFIQSRLVDRVADLEVTSGPKLSLRTREVEEMTRGAELGSECRGGRLVGGPIEGAAVCLANP